MLATAQSGYLTGGKLSLREEVTDADGTTKLQDVKGAVKAETKLSELGFTGDEASLNINTTDEDGNAVTKTVSLTKDSTIQDVVNALKDNGLNASFDANNGRIFVSSKNTGKAADFSLSSATESCYKGQQWKTRDGIGHFEWRRTGCFQKIDRTAWPGYRFFKYIWQ